MSFYSRYISFLFFSFFLISINISVNAAEIPFIDAHSQADKDISFKEILRLMDNADVSHTILSLRGQRQTGQLLSFALRYPGRITPSVRTKGNAYVGNKIGKFKIFLKKQANNPQFRAMAELLLWHAEKTKAPGVTREPSTIEKPPLVVVHPDDPRVKIALNIAIEKNWPFILHIEFVASGSDRDIFMSKLRVLLHQYPNHPFVLIHMGQLQAEEIKHLISSHPNIYFITSKSNPIRGSMPSGEAVVNLFRGSSLALEWKDLIIKYPDRFIFGIDNTWAEDWQKKYVKQVNLWRKALKELPDEVAHAVAHRNAELLWRLPPAR
jgi:hypothetical protein